MTIPTVSLPWGTQAIRSIHGEIVAPQRVYFDRGPYGNEPARGTVSGSPFPGTHLILLLEADPTIDQDALGAAALGREIDFTIRDAHGFKPMTLRGEVADARPTADGFRLVLWVPQRDEAPVPASTPT